MNSWLIKIDYFLFYLEFDLSYYGQWLEMLIVECKLDYWFIRYVILFLNSILNLLNEEYFVRYIRV